MGVRHGARFAGRNRSTISSSHPSGRASLGRRQVETRGSLRGQIWRRAPAAMGRSREFGPVSSSRSGERAGIVRQIRPRGCGHFSGERARTHRRGNPCTSGGGRQAGLHHIVHAQVVEPIPGTNEDKPRAAPFARTFRGAAPILPPQRTSRGPRGAMGSSSGGSWGRRFERNGRAGRENVNAVFDSIERCLDWKKNTWLPLQLQLGDVGFRWDRFLAEQPAVVGPEGELARIHLAVTDALMPIFDSRFKKLRLLQLEEEFRDLKSRLKLAARVAKAAKVIGQLVAAVNDDNSNRYREAHERLLELKSKQADLDLRRTLLAKLETAAPAWSAAIRNRTGVHGRGEAPRDAASAWTWRQLNDELDRRASVSLEVLQAKSEKLREQLRRVTVELIDKRSWASQARRTSSRQRQALVGWLDTIRRIGKGHGIRVSLLRAEAADGIE